MSGNTLRMFHSNVISSVANLSSATDVLLYNRRSDVYTIVGNAIDLPGGMPNSYKITFSGLNPSKLVYGLMLGPNSCEIYPGIAVGIKVTGSSVAYKNTMYLEGDMVYIAPPTIDNETHISASYYKYTKNTDNVYLTHPGVPIIFDTPALGVTSIEVYIQRGAGSVGTGPIYISYAAIFGDEESLEHIGSLVANTKFAVGTTITNNNGASSSCIAGVYTKTSTGRNVTTYNVKLSLVEKPLINILSYLLLKGLPIYVYAQEYNYTDSVKSDSVYREQQNSGMCRILSPLNITNVDGDYYNLDLSLEKI